MQTRYRLLAAAVILIPAVTTLLLLYFVFGISITDLIPAWSDEVVYWHSVHTFQHVGFEGGYYTFAELPARAWFSHFDTHGPWYPLFLGSVARIAGWYWHSMPVLNLTYITGALAVFMVATRPNMRQLILIALLLLVCWPMLVYTTSSLQEGLHLSIAIVLAAAFYRVLTNQEKLPRWLIPASTIVIVFVALMRPTWSLLLLPLFWLGLRRPGWLRLLMAFIGIAAAFLIFQYGSAPYPYGFFAAFQVVMAQSPLEGLWLLIRQFVHNLRRLSAGNILEIVQRYQILLLLVAIMIGLSKSRTFRQIRKRLFEGSTVTANETVFHFLNLGLILLLNLAIYDIFAWRDYRVLAPHLLLSALLLVMCSRPRLVGLLVISNLVLFPAFIAFYGEWYQRNLRVNPDDITAFAETMDDYIRYQPDAASAWCNTLLTDHFYPQLLGLPPGIGITVDGTMELTQLPPRSRYLLMRPELYDQIQDRVDLQPITTIQELDFYLNENAQCEY